MHPSQNTGSAFLLASSGQKKTWDTHLCLVDASPRADMSTLSKPYKYGIQVPTETQKREIVRHVSPPPPLPPLYPHAPMSRPLALVRTVIFIESHAHEKDHEFPETAVGGGPAKFEAALPVFTQQFVGWEPMGSLPKQPIYIPACRRLTTILHYY